MRTYGTRGIVGGPTQRGAEMPNQTAQHLTKAHGYERAAVESFERCDTDGCVSQWSSGVMAEEERLKAYLAKNGGSDYFVALFDLDGNLVPAKLVETRYGTAWAILTGDDPSSPVAKWVSAFPKRESTMRNKGFYEGTVKCPAYVTLCGSGTGLSGALSVRPYTRRSDRGFSRDVEIVDNGCDIKSDRRGCRRS